MSGERELDDFDSESSDDIELATRRKVVEDDEEDEPSNTKEEETRKEEKTRKEENNSSSDSAAPNDKQSPSVGIKSKATSEEKTEEKEDPPKTKGLWFAANDSDSWANSPQDKFLPEQTDEPAPDSKRGKRRGNRGKGRGNRGRGGSKPNTEGTREEKKSTSDPQEGKSDLVWTPKNSNESGEEKPQRKPKK